MSVPTASDPLADLSAAGVSVWLDGLSRELLAGGGLEELIADKHVVGVTTNPTVFALTTDDVRDACDVLRPVYDRTDGVDGRVSVELDPRLAQDADATAALARRLWKAVDRPNLFVKIPATRRGLEAITSAVAEGIGVDATPIFSPERYREVADAYQTGLEQALAAGRDLSGIHSVASFLVSRVDTEIDRRLDALATPEARALKGRAAIAGARLAHRAYEQVTAAPRWQRLAAAGARVQRPLWASIGVEDPSHPDTMYVGELAVAGTVSTMPGATLAAFADHGTLPAGPPETDRYAAAAAHLEALERVGIDFEDVTDTLEREDLAAFEAGGKEPGDMVERGMHSGTTASEEHRESREGGSEGADLLAIYLNDHYSGATGGLELFRRAAQAQQGTEAGEALSGLARQIDEDRDALAGIMTDLGVDIRHSKVAMGWLAEKAGRLKPNGHLFSRSPLSDVLETESMLLGVRGKAACWRTLRALAETDGRLSADRLDALAERADRQSTTLEELRLAAVTRALRTNGPQSPTPTPTSTSTPT